MKNRIMSLCLTAMVLAAVMAAVGCTSAPQKLDRDSSWLVGKWVSVSSGWVDELVLLTDGTGTLKTFENTKITMQVELAFDPALDYFSYEPLKDGRKLKFNYTRNDSNPETGTQLIMEYLKPEDKLVFLREEALIKEVCAGDNSVTMARLGNYYSQAGNTEKEIRLFTAAFDKGNTAGALNLGNLYHRKEDFGSAFEWYSKAADKGEPQAEYNVFVYYYQGLGMEKDPEKAVEWLIKAAEHGSPDAMNVMKQLQSSK